MTGVHRIGSRCGTSFASNQGDRFDGSSIIVSLSDEVGRLGKVISWDHRRRMTQASSVYGSEHVNAYANSGARRACGGSGVYNPGTLISRGRNYAVLVE